MRTNRNNMSDIVKYNTQGICISCRVCGGPSINDQHSKYNIQVCAIIIIIREKTRMNGATPRECLKRSEHRGGNSERDLLDTLRINIFQLRIRSVYICIIVITFDN